MDIDQRLDSELGPQLNRAVGTAVPPLPRYKAAPGPRRIQLPMLGLASVPLALSLRTVGALAAATVAAGGGAAVVVSSHAGNGSSQSTSQVANLGATPDASSSAASPTNNHGAAVTSAVASCKAARPSPDASPKPSPGSRGIGDCVADVASGGRQDHSGTTNGNSGNHPSRPAHPTPPVTTPAHPTPPPHP